MNKDGSNKRQLTYNSVEDNFPSFSRDGQYIVFSSTRSGNEEIWKMPYAYAPITTGISVTSPNGGEVWQHGTYKTLKWSYSGSPGSYVKIELLKSGVLNRLISSSTPNDGSFSWLIPSTQTLGSDYKIRVTSTSNSVYKDTSNNYFRIY
jgi:Tol biopolymer transport system component